MLATTEKANQALTKRHNTRLVLKTIYDQGPISRAKIARTTNLTATTVSTVIGELLGEGLVEEIGSVSIERGKPPTLVALRKDARQVIGLNLAQNFFRGGLLNLRGEVLYQETIPAQGLYGTAALESVMHLVDSLLQHTSEPLLGIGIGAPGVIEAELGLIRRAVNLQWYDLPLIQLIGERFHLPSHVVNDNQASLLAEHHFGVYKQWPNLVVVRVGRGVGAGIMLNGQLVTAHTAGEIGHVTLLTDGERCSCGNNGCLETLVSSRAIVKRARTLLAIHSDSYLGRLVARPTGNSDLEIGQVIQAYQAGDTFLGEILADVGHYLGMALANLIGVVGAIPILLCGSVTGFGQPLLAYIQREVEMRTLAGQRCAPLINFASLESDIIMVGAAALLLKYELGLF